MTVCELVLLVPLSSFRSKFKFSVDTKKNTVINMTTITDAIGLNLSFIRRATNVTTDKIVYTTGAWGWMMKRTTRQINITPVSYTHLTLPTTSRV